MGNVASDVGDVIFGSEDKAIDETPALSFIEAVERYMPLIGGAAMGHGLALGLYAVSPQATNYANLTVGGIVLMTGMVIGGINLYQRIPRGGQTGIFDVYTDAIGSIGGILSWGPLLVGAVLLMIVIALLAFTLQGGPTAILESGILAGPEGVAAAALL